MESILVSACLLGTACRYDGKTKPLPAPILDALKKNYHLIPVCPEILGGLPTPRIPAEIGKDGRVLRADGVEVSAEYARGAEEALRLAALFGCQYALFKAKSPSCGCGEIYDGSFSGKKIAGDGITTALMKQHGIRVFTELDLLENGTLPL